MQKTHFLKMEREADQPCFFKIVLEQTLRDKKLQIPKLFVKKYGDRIPGKILLEDRIGVLWKAEVSRCKGRVYLHNGWEVFAEHYSLRYGHLLVFGYEGNGRFRVIIFDKSATEIKYPYSSIRVENSSSNREDDASTEILDGNSRSRKRRDKSPLLSPQTQKKMRTQSTDKAKRVADSKLTDQGLSLKRTRKRVMKLKNSCDEGYSLFPANEAAGDASNGERDQHSQVSAGMRSFSTFKNAKALRRVGIFETKNSFVVTMKQIYIKPGYRLYIPAWFCRRYLAKEKAEIILCTWNEKAWPANYTKHNGGGAWIGSGWTEFVEDNNLRIRDICVFQLIKATEMIFKVTIYRGGKDTNCFQSLGNRLSKELSCKNAGLKNDQSPSCLSKQGAFEDARNFASQHPFFEVVLLKHHIRHGLNVPSWFVRKIVQRDEYVTLRAVNGSWRVKLVINTKSFQGLLSAGWLLFAKGNFLQAGDVCIFELIKIGDVVLKVSVFRSST